MILTHDGKSPRIDPTARIAPTSVICGDVTIGAKCSIGFGAVITAETGPIAIGANVIVMDTAVIRGIARNPVVIGDDVLIGPRAYLSGCRIGREVFLATGASVFNGAQIGDGAEVRINGTVHIRTRLPAGATVPIGWVAVGDPAEILPATDHDAIWAVQKQLDFPGYVFGEERPAEGQSMMSRVMPRYAATLIRRHAGDSPESN